MSEIQPQVALIVDTADDLIWAELKPDLPQSARSEFLRFRDQHAREQADLRKAVHRARLVAAAVQKGYAAPNETSKLAEGIREIRLHLEKVETICRRLEPFIVPISPGLPKEQRDWIEHEIAVLEQWAATGGISTSSSLKSPLQPLRLRRPDFSTSSEESLHRYSDEVMKQLHNNWLRGVSATAARDANGVPDRERLVQYLEHCLGSEAICRVELECINDRLDWPSRTHAELRHHPDVRGALALLGVDTAPAVGQMVEVDWAALRSIDRAWTINNLVLDDLAMSAECVRDLKRRDIADAIGGHGGAWGRLRKVLDGRVSGAREVTAEQGVRPSDDRKSETDGSRQTTQDGCVMLEIHGPTDTPPDVRDVPSKPYRIRILEDPEQTPLVLQRILEYVNEVPHITDGAIASKLAGNDDFDWRHAPTRSSVNDWRRMALTLASAPAAQMP